ncbi:unnamed protein product [Rhizophagus irregularis]|nr:unnamed protein product [Rhizophagus irregularis]
MISIKKLEIFEIYQFKRQKPKLKSGYVEVQPTFPQKIKESKMSDKAEVPDKSKTSNKSKLDKFLASDNITLNCFIPGERVNLLA